MKSALARGAKAERSRAKGDAGDASEGRSSYDRFKEFEGKRYTGMAVGRGHNWNYEAGKWVEKKITPDKWQFHYNVQKSRTGRAPEGSGAPVGSAYHWYILAHQTATKLDANNYETKMSGVKYKLAHKRAESASWNASDRAQRNKLIALLKETLAELEAELEQPEADLAGASDPGAQEIVENKAPRTRAKRGKATARKPAKRKDTSKTATDEPEEPEGARKVRHLAA